MAPRLGHSAVYFPGLCGDGESRWVKVGAAVDADQPGSLDAFRAQGGVVADEVHGCEHGCGCWFHGVEHGWFSVAAGEVEGLTVESAGSVALWNNYLSSGLPAAPAGCPTELLPLGRVAGASPGGPYGIATSRHDFRCFSRQFRSQN